MFSMYLKSCVFCNFGVQYSTYKNYIQFVNGVVQIYIHFYTDFLSILSVPETALHVSLMTSLNMSITFYLSGVCCPTPELEIMRITSERTDFPDRCEYAYGHSVSYTCDKGYYPVSPDGMSSCQADGTWKPEMPACKQGKNIERTFHTYSTDSSDGPISFHK